MIFLLPLCHHHHHHFPLVFIYCHSDLRDYHLLVSESESADLEILHLHKHYDHHGPVRDGLGLRDQCDLAELGGEHGPRTPHSRRLLAVQRLLYQLGIPSTRQSLDTKYFIRQVVFRGR